MRHIVRVIWISLLAAGSVLAAPAGQEPHQRPAARATNQLIWQPFSQHTFNEAEAGNKLVLLYISAPWDVRDHMMQAATFTDPGVLDLIRKSYVPVRVSTDLRPDIFARYGLGSWPTTTVLLPNGLPFFHPDPSGKSAHRAGGTFFSPERFTSYFSQLADYYEANKKLIESVSKATSDTVLRRINVDRGEVKPQILEVVVGKILDAHKNRPVQPVPGAYFPDFRMMDLVRWYWEKKADRKVLDVMLNHLTDMARGGIYDRLEGGFFRYAQDSMYHVPGFEKMPSVNAQAMDAYLDAYQISRNGVFLKFAKGAMNYFQLHGIDPDTKSFEGPMAAWTESALNGEYYTWTESEVRSLLTPEEFKIAAATYDIAPTGELLDTAPRENVIYMSSGPRILAKRLGMKEDDVAAILDSATRKLYEARNKRPAPVVDPTTYADSSGMAISAFLHAGRVLKKPEYAKQALAALDTLMARCRLEDGLLSHACAVAQNKNGGMGFLEDQSHVGAALLDAYEETADSRYLKEAADLAGVVSEKLADTLSGGYTDREADPKGIGLMSWPLRQLDEEMAEVQVLLRLRYLTGDASYAPKARKVLEAWADEAPGLGVEAASYALVSQEYLNPPLEVLVIGDPSDQATAELRSEALRLYHPWRIVRSFDPSVGKDELEKRGLKGGEKGAEVFFCFDKDCAGPFGGGDDLYLKLQDFLNHRAAPGGKTSTKSS